MTHSWEDPSIKNSIKILREVLKNYSDLNTSWKLSINKIAPEYNFGPDEIEQWLEKCYLAYQFICENFQPILDYGESNADIPDLAISEIQQYEGHTLINMRLREVHDRLKNFYVEEIQLSRVTNEHNQLFSVLKKADERLLTLIREIGESIKSQHEINRESFSELKSLVLEIKKLGDIEWGEAVSRNEYSHGDIISSALLIKYKAYERFVFPVLKDLSGVKNRPPDDPFQVVLILKGGGIKGLALVGAILELQNYYNFYGYVGTSAGAILAGLLALGYKPEELQTILMKTDFKRFEDGGLLWRWITLRYKGYLHPGREFEKWLEEQIERIYNTPKRLMTPPKMNKQCVAARLAVYAAQDKEGEVVFDSEVKEDAKFEVSFAIRASMSIPVYFKPPTHNNRPIFDGGLRQNFPAEHWLSNNPNHNFIGIYLEDKAPEWILMRLKNILLVKNDHQFIDKHQSQVVRINPDPIKITDFDLSDEEAQFLVLEGRAAALEHLLYFLPPEHPRPKEPDVLALRAEADAAKVVAIKMRKQRKLRQKQKRQKWAALAIFISIVLYILLSFYFLRFCLSFL
jgi:predicted acylesterase/phospholipase RssA